MSALELFAAWKAYPLPELNTEGRFDKDYLHREFVAFKAGLDRAPVQAQGERPTAADGLPPIALSSITTYESPHGTLIRRADVECMLSRMKAQGLTDAKDGARYRWLRDKSEPGICAFYLSVGKAFDGVKFNQVTVDEAIDAAIERMTGNAGGEGA